MQQTKQTRFLATLIRIDEISAEFRRLTFQVSDVFSFLPGQYVWIELMTLRYEDPKGSRRPFSICSKPDQHGTFSILVKSTISGYKRSLFETEVGGKVFVHGPFGSTFTIDNLKPDLNVVMIAEETGIAPFLSVIHSIREQLAKVSCACVFLRKNGQMGVVDDELQKKKEQRYIHNFLAVEQVFDWSCIEKLQLEDAEGREWWISGSQEMVDHTYAVLLTNGVKRAQMRFEVHYPSIISGLTVGIVSEVFIKEELLSQAIQSSSNYTIITDPNGIILFANKAVEQSTGYKIEEIIGQTPRLWGGLMDTKPYVNFWNQLLSGNVVSWEVRNRRKNGEIYHAISHTSPLFGKAKELIGFISTEQDITEYTKQTRQLEELTNMMMGRESKIQELKAQIQKLEEQLAITKPVSVEQPPVEESKTPV